jgi:hypothetical protein
MEYGMPFEMASRLSAPFSAERNKYEPARVLVFKQNHYPFLAIGFSKYSQPTNPLPP